jgi:hypothetical protein
MKKLTRADIRGPRLYGPIREDLRRRVIELKRARRVSVGPEVALVFENRATMIFQIEEMCRAESIEQPDKIQEEIDVYNRVLPDDGQLAATLLIEITDEAQLETTLDRLVGLQEHVWLLVGDDRVQARFDPDQWKSDRLAAVQYLRFALPPRAREALRTPGTRLALVIDHSRYAHQATLGEETRASLASDLDSRDHQP